MISIVESILNLLAGKIETQIICCFSEYIILRMEEKNSIQKNAIKKNSIEMLYISSSFVSMIFQKARWGKPIF